MQSRFGARTATSASITPGISSPGTAAICAHSRGSSLPRLCSLAGQPTGRCPTGTTMTSNRNRLDLPPVFGSQTWPDGGTNPLFVVARYGSTGQSGGPIKLDPRSVSLDAAFLESSFVGTQTGGSPGFGGGRTPFKHSGRGDEGLLEQSPHDNVHGDIGGARDNDF